MLQDNDRVMNYNNLQIIWLGHDGFILQQDKVICIDPFNIKDGYKADLILITHEHYDHLSLPDIKKIAKSDTKLIASSSCKDVLKEFNTIILNPGQVHEEEGIVIEAVPAYNTNKYRDPVTKTVFHAKSQEHIGFIITIGGTRVYHAGDTDIIPEMDGMQVDVAILPVSGTYVMTAEEAAKAAIIIKPKLAIPMHYASIIGKVENAQQFAQLCEENNIQVQILEKDAA
jgi:L-ascorbate metabolism protein UlaG (beta-lactamase superfamily)